MRPILRSAAYAAFSVALVPSVSACTGDATVSGSNNLTPIAGSSYVTIVPATTTTTTTLPPGAPTGPQPGDTSPEEQLYTVKAGDSVFAVAALFELSPDVLANYNSWPEGINHPIFVGDVVRIPPDSKVPGVDGSDEDGPGDEQSGSSGDDDCPTTYVITAEDTTRIAVAEKFDITFQQMDAANANTPGYSAFVVGTPITIPCP